VTVEGWRDAVLQAVRDHDAGDPTLLQLMSRLLAEQDDAKQRLRELGYGCIGMPWADVVDDIADVVRR
jgi:hypothetical protein